jgi:hypothetical protein
LAALEDSDGQLDDVGIIAEIGDEVDVFAWMLLNVIWRPCR